MYNVWIRSIIVPDTLYSVAGKDTTNIIPKPDKNYSLASLCGRLKQKTQAVVADGGTGDSNAEAMGESELDEMVKTTIREHNEEMMDIYDSFNAQIVEYKKNISERRPKASSKRKRS